MFLVVVLLLLLLVQSILVGIVTNDNDVVPVTIFPAVVVYALPISQPYIAYRTDPYNNNNDHNTTTNPIPRMITTTTIIHQPYKWKEMYNNKVKELKGKGQLHRSSYLYDEIDASIHCPIHISNIGISKKIHSSSSSSLDSSSTKVQQPPIIHSTFHHTSSSSSIKQIYYTTNYEHLDMYYATTTSSSLSLSSKSKITTTTTNTILQQGIQYPLLYESSIFTHLSPILYDTTGNGIFDMIVTDYDGSITIIGMNQLKLQNQNQNQHKYYHHTQVPRLYIRREWMNYYIPPTTTTTTVVVGTEEPENNTINNSSDSNNSTENIMKQKQKQKVTRDSPNDPFHSYFEYYYSASLNNNHHDNLIRGETINTIHQKVQPELYQRRQEQYTKNRKQQLLEENKKRRLLEIQQPIQQQQQEVLLQSSLLPITTEVVVNEMDEISHVSMHHDPPNHHHHHHRRLEEVQQQEQRSNRGDDDIGIPELDTIDYGGEGDYGETNRGDDYEMQREQNDMRRNEEEEVERKNDHENVDNNKNGEEANMDNVNRDTESIDGKGREEDEDKLNHNIDSESGDNMKGSNDHNINEHKEPQYEDVDQMHGMGDDMSYDTGDDHQQQQQQMMEDDYTMYMKHQHRGGDDHYYGDDMGYGNHDYNSYYDTNNYIRLPPHILTQPTIVEVPKLYSNDKYEKDDMLFVAVSYYFDEDEYDSLLPSYKRFHNTDIGDETETRRGYYIASAIMGYVLGDTNQRWMGQTHLDLSTDYTAPENVTIVGSIPIHSDTTQLSALALCTPTVVDIDGNGIFDVILGTNMGMIYVFDARQMILQKEYWPIQLLYPIEHQIIVEDVIGNTNLEMFVTDISGTITCLTSQAQLIWQHHPILLLSSVLSTEQNTNPTATSPLSLGDIDGDGLLDITHLVRIQQRTFVFAISASTGMLLQHFPIELDGKIVLHDNHDMHTKLTQPLLVDLHTDQTFLKDYIHRQGGTKYTKPIPKKGKKATTKQYGGIGSGLHIVFPHGENIFIVEGSTGCTQKIVIGTEVSAMIQVDDIHGKDTLDLVVVTENGGNVMTFQTLVPYHPLNTWTGGSVRNHRGTSHVHGYSATQGIYVHDISRNQYNVMGVYVTITFEIFDNRPNIQNEPEKQKYLVEIRDGPSWKRALWRYEYNTTGVYTDRVYIRYGPGYYTLHVVLLSTHGIIYEDTIHVGYNINFLDGLGMYLWLPLLIASILIFVMGASRQTNWNNSIDDIDGADDMGGNDHGIIGRSPLPT